MQDAQGTLAVSDEKDSDAEARHRLSDACAEIERKQALVGAFTADGSHRKFSALFELGLEAIVGFRSRDLRK